MNFAVAEFVTGATRRSHYPEGALPDVAFAGRSNVGKSSLINALLGRKRLAHTGSTPGRTREINFFRVDGLLYFVDLPGYGFARVPRAVREQWGPMVEEYLQTRDNLRLLVLALDIRRDLSSGDRTLIDWLIHYNIPHLFVLTKADKLSRSRAAERHRDTGRQLGVTPERLILFSAKTGLGRDALRGVISGLRAGRTADGGVP